MIGINLTGNVRDLCEDHFERLLEPLKGDLKMERHNLFSEKFISWECQFSLNLYLTFCKNSEVCFQFRQANSRIHMENVYSNMRGNYEASLDRTKYEVLVNPSGTGIRMDIRCRKRPLILLIFDKDNISNQWEVWDCSIHDVEGTR